MTIDRDASLGSPVPVGTVTMYAGAFDADSVERLKKQGWLPCDGAERSVSEYRVLYEVLGNAHGGDGATFRVPDLRGRFVRGVDAGARRDPDVERRDRPAAGGNTGDKVGSVQLDQFRSHSHSATHLPTGFHWHAHTAETLYVAKYNSGSAETDRTGGNETRPANLALNYIICFK